MLTGYLSVVSQMLNQAGLWRGGLIGMEARVGGGGPWGKMKTPSGIYVNDVPRPLASFDLVTDRYPVYALDIRKKKLTWLNLVSPPCSVPTCQLFSNSLTNPMTQSYQTAY